MLCVSPDLKSLRIWECRCSALKPKGDRRKSLIRFLGGTHYAKYPALTFESELDKLVVSVRAGFMRLSPTQPTSTMLSLNC